MDGQHNTVRQKERSYLPMGFYLFNSSPSFKHFYKLDTARYRPLHLIEAYVWPEKYWLVWAGPLANHLFNFNFIFLSDGITAAAERAACFTDLYRR